MVEVFQVDDRYAGPVLGDRWQVLASAIGPTFYVYDHERRDAVRAVSGDTLRFEKIIYALSHLGFTATEIEGMKEASVKIADELKQEVDMAKAVTVSAAQAKAQASMEARAAMKAAAKMDAKIGPKGKLAVVKAVVPVKAAAPAKVVAGVKVGAFTKELIMRGLDNAGVIAELGKAFPDKANSVSNVSFYRTQLRKEGAIAQK